jgi:hypothetical protein
MENVDKILFISNTRLIVMNLRYWNMEEARGCTFLYILTLQNIYNSLRGYF